MVNFGQFNYKLAGSASVNAPLPHQQNTQHAGANFFKSQEGFNKNGVEAVKGIERGSENIQIGRKPSSNASNPIGRSVSANPLEGFDASGLAKFDARERSPYSVDDVRGNRLYALA